VTCSKQAQHHKVTVTCSKQAQHHKVTVTCSKQAQHHKVTVTCSKQAQHHKVSIAYWRQDCTAERSLHSDYGKGWASVDSWFDSCQGQQMFLHWLPAETRYLFFIKTPRQSLGPSSLLFNGYCELFPRGQSGRDVKLTAHLHQVPRLWMSAAIPYLHSSHMSWGVIGQLYLDRKDLSVFKNMAATCAGRGLSVNLCNLNLARRLNSIKYSGASGHARWFNGE
jgi:hypothetical protein